jgi:LPXTG-motif cell wall-anchored protein
MNAITRMSAVAIAIGIFAAAVSVAAPAQADSGKVDICHATGNGKYVPQSIAKAGAANGHATHQDGADIIPAYSWVDGKVRYYFGGLNLDKAALLATGCKAPATPVTAAPVAPVYVPASCSNPELPYGRVVVPANRGEGVGATTEPAVNAGHTDWSVAYTLNADTEDRAYSWPSGTSGTYSFHVVPITEDPMWITDSKTGVGQCEMPETGASLPWALAGGLLLGGVALFGASKIRRRNERDAA